MANNNTNMTVTISAVDRTSAAIQAVTHKLGGITAPVATATKAVARFGSAAAGATVRMTTRIAKAMAHLGSTAAHTGVRMVEAFAPIGALGSVLSVAGLAKVTTDWARFSQGLGFDAARIGSNVSELHALEGSARLSGVSADAAADGLRTLQDVMVDTTDGRDMQALVYFRKLGVAFDDGAGHARRATDALPELADAIMRIKDPSRQARVATVLFGGAAESMLPWLRHGSASMREYAAIARHYGVETEDSAFKAEYFTKSQGQLALAFEGLGHSIAAKVAPPLSRLMVAIAELVNKWRKPIADMFGEWAKKAEDWLKSVDWGAMIKHVEELATKFQSLMDGIANYNAPPWLKWVMKQFSSGGDQGELTPDGKIPMPRPEGVESEAPPLTPSQHTDRGRLMMGMFEGSGNDWSHDDAAAIIAGLDRESGLRDQVEGDKDQNGVFQAYGIAQWHPDRQQQFNEWSRKGGTPDGRDIRHSSIEDQTRFIEWDLSKGKYKDVGNHMRAAKTLDEKMAIFDVEYEGPKDKAGAIRHDTPRAHQWAAQSATIAAAPSTLDGELRHRLEVQGRDEREDAHLEPPPEEPLPVPGKQSANAIKVDVHFRGLPAGATAVATSSGGAAPSVRVERAMG